VDAERPRTEWEARVAKAKRDGTWYGPDEEPVTYPPRTKRARFWSAFALTLLATIVLDTLLHIALHRPGSLVSGGALLDGLFQGLFPAYLVGWSFTRPPRRKP
jgi:hypothetical protein